MPRKGYIAKREQLADPVYQSTLVNKFVNSMMWDGKKSDRPVHLLQRHEEA